MKFVCSMPIALMAAIFASVCAQEEYSDWPQWRGTNRDGVAPNSPKLLDAWPKEGPKLLWKSGWIPGGHAGGIGSPVVAEGKVFLYVSWRHPLDGGNDYCLVTKKILEEWGWLQDIPADLAKKIEDARVSPTRPNVGGNYSEFNWWDATIEQQDANVEAFLKKYPQLDAGIKECIASLSPKDAEKYGSYIKRRFCPNRKGQSRGRTWDELGKLNSQLLDKKYPTINPWYFGLQKYGMLDGDELSGVLFSTVERTTTMTDSVVCLDAATGKELWKKNFPAAKDRPASFLGAAGTPAVWGGKVYFAGIMGLYCLSAKDGTLLWQVKGGGVNASVGVANGIVYGTVGGQPLSAYNAENGNVIWKSNPNAGSVNSSHVVWASGGKSYIIACGGGATYCCIDMETGKVIWNIKCGAPGGPTPVISGDILVVQPEGSTKAYKMTPVNAELLWTKAISDGAAGPVIYQNHVYLHTSYYAAPWWHCLDLKTGEEKWKQQSSIDASCNCSSPIVADGKIFHTLGNGHAIENYYVEMLTPTPEKYVQLGVFNPEAAPLASPTIAGGKLYLRLWDGLACYDLRAK